MTHVTLGDNGARGRCSEARKGPPRLKIETCADYTSESLGTKFRVDRIIGS